MENDRGFHGSKENLDSNNRNNTEYIPTRCRITKPAPPKPATNPMQFVKISPCKLLSSAKEQIKKAEEVKVVRSGIRDDAEDWQANLDNWKSSRRKRVEHIIERVVEVKKFEQQDLEGRTRRKSKTFHEILEEKGKRRTKLSIPIYEDDSNDLSDLGLGQSNDTKISNEETLQNEQYESYERRESSTSSTIEQEQPVSESESKSDLNDNNQNQWQENTFTEKQTIAENQRITNENTSCYKIENNFKKMTINEVRSENNNKEVEQEQQYTYESAIQGYRSRVKSNLSTQFDSQSSEDQETNIIVPKGSILKKRELFEEKVFEMNSLESTSSKRLQQDFVNSQSLKERLKSLEKCGATTIAPVVTNERSTTNIHNTTNFASTSEVQQTWNEVERETKSKNRNSMLENIKSDLEKSRNKWREETATTSDLPEWNNISNDRPSSPDTNMFVDKIEKFCNSLDKLGADNQAVRIDIYDNYKPPIEDYPALNSPMDLLTGTSQYCDTDREDSGIHTADVSCSVSQADEPVEDTESTDNIEAIEKYPPSECSSDMRPVVWPVIDTEFVVDFPLGPPVTPLEPPKEKPPPPPRPAPDDDDENDTARLKKEIRLKRSSFLGINVPECLDNIPKTPDTFQIENVLERQQQLYRGLHGSFSEAGDSQDSGVEMDRGLNQIPTPDGWCSAISDFDQLQPSTIANKVYSEGGIVFEEDEIVKKEKEIIALVEKEEQWRVGSSGNQYRKQDLTKSYSAPKLDLLDHPMTAFNEPVEDDEHFEMMQVKRELLQLEQEASLKRQREASRLNKLAEMNASAERLSNKRLSLEDITNSGMVHPSMSHQQSNADHRKSMPELQHNNAMYINTYNARCNIDNVPLHKPLVRPARPSLPVQYDTNKPIMMGLPITPPNNDNLPRLRPKSQGDLREKFNYNQHWLIQEAEQRRISNQMNPASMSARCDWKLTRPDKHLPDSVIQTLTKRMQNKLSMPVVLPRNDNLPVYNPHHPVPGQLHHSQLMEESQDKMLSVSGKKKCSYCENELGRGAAMIIESLCLFYHMECFKCCVCHVQLGDGRMGTDVRVRNSKLHCHNCYSSDDGVKFSCV